MGENKNMKENFYQKQYDSWKTVIPSTMQYIGLMLGVGSIASEFSEKTPKELDYLSLGVIMIAGAGIYLYGKGLEYLHRQEELSASFTPLEETIREELKRMKL